MIDALLDPAFNGADLALVLAVLAAAVWGSRRDARKNAARDAEQVAP